MSNLVWILAGALVRLFRSRQSLLIENLALRQQLVVFNPVPDSQQGTSCSGCPFNAFGPRGNRR